MDETRPLGRLGGGSAPVDRPRLHAACALEAIGVGARALELGVEHARTRQQFGRPVGVFQAVSHALATTFVELETARSVAYWAAWCVAESDPQAPVAAAAAKAKATEAAVAACERSIQVHGGIGFTWEHVLHRLYKRAQWLERFGDGPDELRAAVAAAILDDVSDQKERDGLQSIVA
jgi:alkylation response protein AidB-like acyl-CoA dehydrogenase